MSAWHLISANYPPTICGVGDHTSLLAAELAAAGCEVHVWTNGHGPDAQDHGATVHRVPGFGFAGRRALDRGLARFPGPRLLFVQYTPSSYGLKAMNIPFAAWVLKRRRVYGDDARVNFHEVIHPWVRRPLKYNLIAAANRVMGWLLVKASGRMYLSTDDWRPMLRALGAGRRPMQWLPIMANIPAASPGAAPAFRATLSAGPVIGHFGTYGPLIRDMLSDAFVEVMRQAPEAHILLIGSGGDRFLSEHPEWAGRMSATGALTPDRVAAALAACDLIVQPVPFGANARRGSLLAALASGVAVIANRGRMTEPLWDALTLTGGAAVEYGSRARALLDDAALRQTVAATGKSFYDRYFSTMKRLEVLLPTAPPSPPL